MDRNTLEQQALQHLNRGDTEAALRSYLTILKFDPRDVRIRQKVGDLYARTNRPNDAERVWRDLYEQLVGAAAHRQAVSILKQLVTLKPEDARYHYDLGECYFNSGYPNDARVHYDTAMKLDIAASRPIDAAKAARRISELASGDTNARLKVAELLEAGNDRHGAQRVYQEVMEEFRRRGRPDEVGRVAELALRLNPEDAGLLLDAAAARLEANDPKKALGHLQAAFPQVGREVRTLDLLARALEAVGSTEKALKVLAELARTTAEAGDLAGEADALRRAMKLSPSDQELRRRLDDAEARLSRRERRLTTLALAQPDTEDELRAQVRAEVHARYGFVDRAEQGLSTALAAAPNARALLASLAELYAATGRIPEAVSRIERLLPLAAAESDAVVDRLAVLRGQGPRGAEPSPRGAEPPAAPAVRPEPTAPVESAEERGDKLAAAGDAAGAILAWREVLAEDPMNDGVLTKIAALRSRSRPAPEPAPSDGTFAEVSPEAFEEEDPFSEEALRVGEIDEARAALAIGDTAGALSLLSGASGLEARVLEAMAHQARGEAALALEGLREATNDVDEKDEAYPESLFVLAGLYIETGKHRAALRLVEELLDLAPDYRTKDTLARQRGLLKLQARS